MKILETNFFLIPIHCRIENDDGSIVDSLFFIDNLSKKIFDTKISLNKIENPEILSFISNNKDIFGNTQENEMLLSDFIDKSIPTMEDIEKIVFEKSKSDNFEQE